MAGKYSINKLYMGSIAWRLIAFILDLMNCAAAQGGRMPSTLDWSRGFTRQIPEIDFLRFLGTQPSTGERTTSHTRLESFIALLNAQNRRKCTTQQLLFPFYLQPRGRIPVTVTARTYTVTEERRRQFAPSSEIFHGKYGVETSQ
jgi:hypothetical protein